MDLIHTILANYAIHYISSRSNLSAVHKGDLVDGPWVSDIEDDDPCFPLRVPTDAELRVIQAIRPMVLDIMRSQATSLFLPPRVQLESFPQL